MTNMGTGVGQNNSFNPLYPIITPLYSQDEFRSLYPSLNNPSVGSGSSPFSDPASSFPTYPVWHTPYLDETARKAEKAYDAVYFDLTKISLFPDLKLDRVSVQTLKEIERAAASGVITSCLFGIIKVLDVVSQLGIGFAVVTSLTLLLGAFTGFSVPGALLSAVVVIPLVNSILFGALAFKIINCVLERLNGRLIKYSFNAAIEKEKYLIGHLKTWLELKNLPNLKKNIDQVKQQFDRIQQTDFHQEREKKVVYLRHILQKIEDFQETERQLNIKNSMPLLSQYLKI